MLKICAICDKKAMTGKSVVRKGMLKKKGGTGSKIVRSSKRQFLPNLQKIRIQLGGHTRQAYICTRCLKAGKVVKAAKNKAVKA